MTADRSAVVPVAIGGIGGSGTRVFASILGALGYHLGDDLNGSNDNLWYTLLFKWRAVIDLPDPELESLAVLFRTAMSGESTGARPVDVEDVVDRFGLLTARPGHATEYLAERAASLEHGLVSGERHPLWGWKEPNTHVLVPRLVDHYPGLRYLHVIRNGFDMAFSGNRNQLSYWADRLFCMSDVVPDDPAVALRYWRLTNERIERLRRRAAFPILEVGFETLCQRPVAVIQLIAEFCQVPISADAAREIADEFVTAPATIGRADDRDLSGLDPEDCRYARVVAERMQDLPSPRDPSTAAPRSP